MNKINKLNSFSIKKEYTFIIVIELYSFYLLELTYIIDICIPKTLETIIA